MIEPKKIANHTHHSEGALLAAAEVANSDESPALYALANAVHSFYCRDEEVHRVHSQTPPRDPRYDAVYEGLMELLRKHGG